MKDNHQMGIFSLQGLWVTSC